VPRRRPLLEELERRLAPASYAVNAQLQISRLMDGADVAGSARSVVFFESGVADYEVLQQGLSTAADSVVLDSGGDGLCEMAAFVAQRHNLSSISLVAHGAPGTIVLGTNTLNARSIGQDSETLAGIGSALAANGELDLWSCQVAAGAAGQSFVATLAAATARGVAASEQAVGAAALGGSWQLGVRVAGAQGTVPFSEASLNAFGQVLGAWSAAAALATARAGQTATLLANGKVLVAGGYNTSPLASAELYDPATNTWASAGSMATARYAQTATLLPNGEVLVTGGLGPAGVLASAELYNPATNMWSPAAPLAAAREQHTATLLANGLVLVAGGLGKNGTVKTAELYDPAKNTWSPAGSLTTGRSQLTATPLMSGQVLVTGGLDSDLNPLTSAELYDPTHNSWSLAAAMGTGRYAHTATLLSSGAVLVAGGLVNNVQALASTELYDPASNTWTPGPDMISARGEQTATLLPSGQVLVAGGVSVVATLASAELFDPAASAWSATMSMAAPRAIHAAVLLADGRVLVTGGDNGGTILSRAEIYDPAGIPPPATPFILLSAPGGTYSGFAFSAAALVLGANSSPLASPGDSSLSYTYYVGATVSGTGSPTPPASAGTYTVVAHWVSNNPAYASADSAPVTFVISPAPVTVTADAQSKPAGAADPPLTYRITQGALIGDDVFTGALSRASGESPGTYAIGQGTLALNSNYALKFVSANLTVTPATRLVISTPGSAKLVAGDVTLFTVTAQDSAGRTVPAYTGTVQLASTDKGAMLGASPLPATYTFTAGDAGAHAFAVTFATAGAQTLSVTDQANHSLTATTDSLPVVLPFSKYVLSIVGGNPAVAGNSFLVKVQASDELGNPIAYPYNGPGTLTMASTPVDPQGNLPATFTLDTNGLGFFAGNLKTVGSYTINVTGGAFLGTSSVSVVPASAQQFKVTSPATATTSHAFNFTVMAQDAFGNLATSYVGRIHFTSTDPFAILPDDSTLPGGAGIFTATFKSSGTQTITVTDKITDPPIKGTSVTVAPALLVTSFTPTPTGFTVGFNKPFIPDALTLYGVGLNTVQDVMLVGAHVGPIMGSLVVDPTNTSLTFNATANGLLLLNNFASVVLPDDTYTVTLVSGSQGNGFMDTLGASLDGAGSGGHANFSTTFSTSYQAKAVPVLAIPDFARGPDAANPIKVPNDLAVGTPVTFYNATQVSDVTFTLRYNPSLLNITGALSGPSSDATDAAGTFTLVAPPTIIDASHAQASFHFSDPNPQGGASTPATVVLGDIVATVPNSAASNYKAKELLQPSNIVVNQGANPGAVAAAGVHVNAYLGDVTGNGAIDLLDLFNAMKVAQGADTGFAAYQLLDPAVVGDAANDLSVDAGAISTIAAYTAKFPTQAIPTIPTGLAIKPVGADPTLSLGPVGRIDNPSYLSVPILLDNPHPEGSTGMTEAVLALTYDPSALRVTPADITLGSIPGLAGWQISSVIDPVNGKIGITLFGPEALATTQGGVLVNIAFQPVPGAARLTAVRLVESLTLNGQLFTTQVDDTQGQLVLSPGTDEAVAPWGRSEIGRKHRQVTNRPHMPAGT
jgi:hypothetical protein